MSKVENSVRTSNAEKIGVSEQQIRLHVDIRLYDASDTSKLNILTITVCWNNLLLCIFLNKRNFSGIYLLQKRDFSVDLFWVW